MLLAVRQHARLELPHSYAISGGIPSDRAFELESGAISILSTGFVTIGDETTFRDL